MFDGIKIYAAGKVTKATWREEIFPIELPDEHVECATPEEWWPSGRPIGGLPGATYSGPFPVGCSQGCAGRQEGTFHGTSRSNGSFHIRKCSGAHQGCVTGGSRAEVARLCLKSIDECTHVFTWLEDTTALGTLVELGYARASGKRVYIYRAGMGLTSHELWFAEQIATFSKFAPSAQEAWRDFKLRLTLDVTGRVISG